MIPLCGQGMGLLEEDFAIILVCILRSMYQVGTKKEPESGKLRGCGIGCKERPRLFLLTGT